MNLTHIKKSMNYRVNSIAAHKFAKLVLLKAYNSIHKFHIIFIKETYLDSNISPNDSDLEIPRYNLVRCDHSLSSTVNVSCRIKSESIFKIVLFRTNTFSLTLVFTKFCPKSNKSIARLIRSIFVLWECQKSRK